MGNTHPTICSVIIRISAVKRRELSAPFLRELGDLMSAETSLTEPYWLPRYTLSRNKMPLHHEDDLWLFGQYTSKVAFESGGFCIQINCELA